MKAVCDRIPTLEDLEKNNINNNSNEYLSMKKTNYVIFRYSYKDEIARRMKKEYKFYNYCILSVSISFILGLIIGVTIMSSTQTFNNQKLTKNSTKTSISRSLNSLKVDDLKDIERKERKAKNNFTTVSFTGVDKYKKDIYPKGLTEDMKDILKDTKEYKQLTFNKTNFVISDKTVLYNNVFWGPEVENSMPQGYGINSAEIWERYVSQSEVVKMETGCGRMQNRLVTFKDGLQACVRYRQNTDQIQGEIFSFYVANLLNLSNLAPSVVKIVDLKDKLWKNVAEDIAAAQWNSNRAVVLTQYIPSLESAKIPEILKPSNRHLNKNDVLKMSLREKESEESKQILIDKLKTKSLKVKSDIEASDHIEMELNKKTVDLFVELAQWSDLIIFDYLTANLDRIVNNLFNFQWNINIMDGPAHNLAKKMDSGLLVFLDNESGLLHGYRLLKKYNVYHSLMLDNLCVFRRTTIESLKTLYKANNVGIKISDMFHRKNNAVVRDILPPLPEKNAKILHERIGRVLSQVDECEQKFSNR
ncbi:extracellular serine/threonine protein kinase four-jointed-like [Pectinophora gossypiella]|uniref:extracellular serine/threonine protein kinase four-jointed-like n=1 Tax=Pectinophora gossypiella TaxID=13191 RepID=UPI00214E522D|nr:extracellular serine/threonine protein kinase four-jointed-like [Pectinophora gossypiella]